ncbi:ketopantoate reductase C-terminal domain-containing protein (plasmid) [Kozakia baliensis]|uniref:ketopantoate reductase family protein n=1 Tax=Kozakia baliensis TaxID=153496 RepID=UPI00345B6891
MAGARICVAGVGALGGTIAAMLARCDVDLSVVARGETLRAICEDGLVLEDAEGLHRCTPKADIVAPRHVQDVIVLAGKAYQLPGLAHAVAHAIGPETLIIPVVNGLPWWLAGLPGPMQAAHDLLDRDSILAATFPAQTLVGAVAYALTSRMGAARVRSERQPMLVLGPAGSDAQVRLPWVVALFRAAGMKVLPSEDIRCDVWNKMAANLATNPLSVVCEASLSDMATTGETASVIRAVLAETLAVGRACGLASLQDVDHIMNLVAAGGKHETSMLQDYRAGRILELAAIGNTVMEIGKAHGVPVPVTSAIVGLAAFKAARRI